MKSLFTGDQLAKAIEKIFLLDRFVQWTGERTPGLKMFLEGCGIVDLQETDGGSARLHTDNGYYLVPVGSWLVKAPDGSVHAFGEGVRFMSKEQEELQKRLDELEIPIRVNVEKPITSFYPEDPYETEVVEEGNAISLRRKLDKDGKPILKKNLFFTNPHADTAYSGTVERKRRENETPRWKDKFATEAEKWTWK